MDGHQLEGFETVSIELNGLVSSPILPFYDYHPSTPLLTTIIARQDIGWLELRFFPFVWLLGCIPRRLQGQDFDNIIGPPFFWAMKVALQRLGLECGTPALTASYQPVLFFEGRDKSVALEAVARKLGPHFLTRWQGTMENPGRDNIAACTGHTTLPQDAQGGSSSQSNSGYQSGPSSATSSDNLTTAQQTAVGSEAVGQSSNPTVAETSASSRKRKRSATPEPASSGNTFVHVGEESAKRGRNGPPPGIPIITPVPRTPVSGPSKKYPRGAVFAMTHTPDTYPHPQNDHPSALSGTKKKSGQRGPAKSSSEQAEDQEPSNTQVGGSGTEIFAVAIPDYNQYSSAMNQSADTLTGGYYATTTNQTSPPVYTNNFGWYDQVHAANTAQYVMPDISDACSGGYYAAADYTADQLDFPDIIETGGASTSQIAAELPSDQVMEPDAALLTQSFAGYDNQQVGNQNPFGIGHDEFQLNHDANQIFNMAYPEYTPLFSSDQNFADSVKQPFNCFQNPGFAPGVPGLLTGDFSGWSFD
ncbi:hypothetical protein BYT27DRAFT_6640219 [Phlegmacium glaucopus]|nr:hypothetical protein BYT27DRAFT_6640219 [Phlegmacium glaucopus]